jgi:hypothetical protein
MLAAVLGWSAAVAVIFTVADLSAEDAGDQQAAIKASVESAIGFLQDRGETWKDSRQCASCHHVPLMTWAMHEVQKHQVAIDEDIYKDTIAWYYTEGDPAKLFNRFIAEEEEYQNPLSLVSAYALMSATNDPKEADHRQYTVKFLQGIIDAQQPDGSFKSFFGRKPIMAKSEALTLWLYNLTSWPNQPEELRAMVAPMRAKALEWLKSHQEDSESHVLALRLWMLASDQDQPQETAALIERILKQQREDGGWSQADNRGSDAYATAHVLFAFQAAGVDATHESLTRGVDFLLKTQAKDGSWPMISRENPPILVHAVSAVTRKPVLIREDPPMEATGKNSEPISFTATAWATVALSKLLP